jgi:hypothetical protein
MNVSSRFVEHRHLANPAVPFFAVVSRIVAPSSSRTPRPVNQKVVFFSGFDRAASNFALIDADGAVNDDFDLPPIFPGESYPRPGPAKDGGSPTECSNPVG